MSGILVGVANLAWVATSQVLYTAAGTYTETIPSGATTVVVECWGPGGIGGAAPITYGGGGGGAGGYTRCSLNVGTSNGKTFVVIVGTEGNGFTVTRSSVAPGSISGFTTIMGGTGVAGGDGGAGTGGTGGGGGTATNANSGAVITIGGTGVVGSNAFVGGAGGTGITGLHAGPYGTGGHGFVGGTNNGQNGAVSFFYT